MERLVRRGVRPEAAARALGASESQYYLWRSIGDGRPYRRPGQTTPVPSDPIYQQLTERVAVAEQQFQSVMTLMAVSKVRTTDDALKVLARRFPEWRERAEVTVDVRARAEELAATLDGVTAEELIAEAEQLVRGLS